MTKRIVAAIFENLTEAERGVAELRNAGIDDDKISVVQHSNRPPQLRQVCYAPMTGAAKRAICA